MKTINGLESLIELAKNQQAVRTKTKKKTTTYKWSIHYIKYLTKEWNYQNQMHV